MEAMLNALKDMMTPLGALMNTLGGALFTAGVYMENGVLDLPAFSKPYQIAYQATGNNTTIATQIRDAIVADTDTFTAFFSGIGSPFVASTGQIMQDISGIMMTMAPFLSAMIDWLKGLREIDVLTAAILKNI